MQNSNSGKVTEVRDGVIYAEGLSNVGVNELVEVYTENFQVIPGIALELNEDRVGIVVIGNYSEIKQGDSVEATGKLPSINVNDNFKGRVVNELGIPVDGKGEIDLGGAKEMLLDRIAPGVIARKDVTRPLQTGILAIDSMIPVGRGQRQLIIGDRLTGKTAVTLDTIINQIDKDCVCIYVSIGQKTSKLAQIVRTLEDHNALENTIIVSANASDPSSSQYLAAFTGTAIGEYFAESGRDALVVYDDLSKHAQAYRKISLVLRRPSGREAYPGDIFYLHSKILERGVQYSDELGAGSLTALPIIETQAGDISAYIPTNVISITDGQIFLEKDLFNSGQRPAISVGISVSRVGGAAQTKALKQVAGQIKLELAQFKELAAFSQFGSDLDKETQAKLSRGERLMYIFRQDQFEPRTVPEMVALVYAGTHGYLDEIPLEKISIWVEELVKFLDREQAAVIDPDQKVEGEVEEKLQALLAEFNKQFSEIYLA